MSDIDQTVPGMDHGDNGANNGPTEAELLDAVLANSPIMDEVGLNDPLPEEEIPEVDPVSEDDVEDPEESEEVVSDEEEEEYVEEAEGEDGAEEAPTQETDVFTADDLDLDARVRVKVDGEEMDVSFADLLKSYQTDASISNKGRELGEARKQLEAERQQALAEVQEIGEASTAILMGNEQNLAKQYHDIEAQIEKARAEDDTYELEKLKDKREQAQKKYWNARKQREGLQSKLQEQKAAEQQQAYQQQMEYFSATINDYVPGFNAETAGEIREFAIKEGLNSEIVDSIMDPTVVKMLNEFRLLKQGVSKGEAKRKAVPAKKAVPTKKAKSPSKKAQDKANMVKARAFKEGASQDDQMAFLKDYAAKSLNNI